ncbi:response regulator transcription factor [Paenibacillus nasutitermitis]|uniref:Two-component system, response regulator YesN n=1 Tax=Paenibacillus nasutitermitis TaxID=1652958 RepID=A0A916YII7_9BACL|nr:response regulator [Paenibacillus nasutitermitis]GGD47266.1 hypothetical protein GCM10010911_00980 [Paenibacillus nasutitermitis]
MYRLLIVDDEPIIVESLLDLFERKAGLELEVYGVCASTDALDMLERTKIDIVLTDIRMPGLSGIELHREIIGRWPWCKVIFLSGYNDFEFIQEVMRNGGVDYLLKSEGSDAIVCAVQKAMQALTDAIEVENLIERSMKQTQKIQPFLQKELLWRLTQSDAHSLHSIGEQFRELNIPLKAEEPVLLVIGRIDEWREGTSAFDKALYLFAVQNIADEYMGATIRQVSFEFEEKSKIAWLIQLNHDLIHPGGELEARQRTLSFVKGAAEMIQHACDNLLTMKLSFAVGTTYREWHELSDLFEHLRLLMSRGLGLGHELLLLEQKSSEVAVDTYDRELRNQMKKIALIQTLLENGQKEQFFAEYVALMKVAAAGSETMDGIRTEIYFTLVSIFLSYVNRWKVRDEIGDAVNLGKMTLLDWNHWPEITDYFSQLAEAIFEWKSSGQDFQEMDVISQVQHYVLHNLAGDLSLNRIAEMVGHNPSYLSRLYKRITGEGISEFIMAVRIKKTQELLRENKLKISEISKAVGFLSEQSFYRFFRKVTNLTPQEYRDQDSKSTDASRM